MISALPTRSPATHVRLLQAATVAAGVALLLARPLVAVHLGWGVPEVLLLFTVVGLLGLVAPCAGGTRRGAPAAIVATAAAAGVLVFVAGRVLSAGHSPQPGTAALVGLNTAAAFAEEALFRRAAFAALLPYGPGVAVGASALLFGFAHVTVYGWWAFPVDAAAGLVLGWQRWASGSWAVPAVTHALADLLVVI